MTIETIIANVDYAGALAKTTQTMVRAARAFEYGLLVSETDLNDLVKTIENAASRLVDGIILYAPNLNISDDELISMSKKYSNGTS